MTDTIKAGDECWLELNDTFGSRQQVTVVRVYRGGNVLVNMGEFKRQCGIQYLKKLTPEELKQKLG